MSLENAVISGYLGTNQWFHKVEIEYYFYMKKKKIVGIYIFTPLSVIEPGYPVIIVICDTHATKASSQ